MKGSLDAFAFADIVGEAFKKCNPDFSIRKIPVADGGDFTGEVLRRALHAEVVEMEVNNPLGKKVKSKYAVSGKTAVIEMADASGIKLLQPNELDPMVASSYGTGQLIAAAIKGGCTEILLGIGGSATVDGGSGMLEALGFKLLDSRGEPLAGNGKNLASVKKIVKPDIPGNVSIKIICDVDNPLLGPNGAAEVFGPQKGASPEMLPLLENGLANWAAILEKEAGTDLAALDGAGAAGGIALPLKAFFNGDIVPGADFILSRLNFEKHVKWAGLVVTGEGKIDSQTLNNKAPAAVAKIARKWEKPVIAIGGSVHKEASEVFNGTFSILNRPMPLENAMAEAPQLLYNTAFELAQLISALFLRNKL